MHSVVRTLLALGTAASVGIAGATGGAHAATITASFQVRVALAPSVIPYDSTAVLGALTTPGAMCTAAVIYANGKTATGFAHYLKKQFKVPTSHIVRWTWHEKSLNKSGKATVTCTLKGKSVTESTPFKISRSGGS
jgi:hypothetical protein